MMSAKKRARLREAWKSADKADDIAKQFGLSSGQSVRNFWQSERDAGRMDFAIGNQRPHFASAAACIDGEEDDLGASEMSANEKATGCLLDALRIAHDGDALRALDEASPVSLIEERNDRASEFALRRARYARGGLGLRDLIVRAFLKKRNERLSCG